MPSEKPSKKIPTKRIHPSIKKDGVNPSDFLKYDFRTSCEDCSHFDSLKNLCTLGYNPAPHLKAQQLRDYEASGKIAQCRFLEVD
ncbi:MAG TPA: hypothetical protein VIG33_17130 [Pseudobdellovibrionaceae bacterium]|jgi:hypothetical protein